MNKLKITLNEDGSVSQFAPDFKIMRGSYRNVLINIEVPHSLLLDPVNDTEGTNQTGNKVHIGGIITTSTGKHLQTKRYDLQRVKDFTRNGTDYRLYQRKMPKEFTMWDTVNEQEEAQSGALKVVINVVNWLINDLNAKIEEISASPSFTLEIQPSTFLSEAEEIAEPSNFDELHSQVQEMGAEIDELQQDLYGEDGLGEFLTSRLKAGHKITLEKVDGQVKISVQTIRANEIPIDAIKDLEATDVQKALEDLSKKVDDEYVDAVIGESEHLVDNTDPHRPIIKHDKTKIDRADIVDNVTTADASKVLSANQGVVIKTEIEAEKSERKAADTSLQNQITTLETVKASKTEMNEAISKAIRAVVNSAPEAFDTLKEIADWIANDEQGSAALVLRVAAAETAIAEEKTARENADKTLQDNINAEAETRKNTDDALTNSKIDNVALESGTNNGTLKLTITINGKSTTIDNIKVTGLKGAAFKESGEFVTSVNGESGAITGIATNESVAVAIQAAIGDALGGAY